MDAIWTTMEEWGSSVELDYGIFCLIPILVILIIALWKKHTFMSILGGVIIGFLMIAQFNPLMRQWQYVGPARLRTFWQPCGADD